MSNAKIELTHVRVNNLKDLCLSIPHGQWLSICGLSGSGKSSLAFDTLYAEGQRRYIEALSVRTRQFVQQLDRPEADHISGLPPAIAIRAPRGKPGPGTTLGSASEIEPHLRLLFSKIATGFCPECGSAISRDTPESVAAWICAQGENQKAVVAFVASGDSLEDAIRDGFVRGYVDGAFVDLADMTAITGEIPVVVDRIKTGDADPARLTESLETAFHCGEGRAIVFIAEARHSFSSDTTCPQGHVTLPPLEPRLFSASNSEFACETCRGTGVIRETLEACYACASTRLKTLPLCFRVAQRNFAEVCSLSVGEALAFLDSLQLSPSQQQTVARIIESMQNRLRFLVEAGLEYLTLDRPLRSLSSGESQRVLLTTVLSTTLVNMLFVLDEPSIGLHAENVRQINDAISKIHRRGNTVVVVDHDPNVIRAAQRVVEIGPAAGADGGEIVFDGSVEELLQQPESLTGEYLSGRRGFSTGQENRRQSHRFMKLIGARGRNLKNINVEFPLGVLCAVTGVSGAGKTSLVQNTLFGAVSKQFGTDIAGTLPYEEIYGADWVSEVVLVDASPIGKSSRSNPVTYVKAFSEIRNCFADTPDASRRNFGPGKFSFNVAGGRCEKCRGDGQLSLNMQFMADLHVRCDQCQGTRFREDVLAVRYRDRNIAQVLAMTVREAFPFFRGHPAVQTKLKALIDVGLEYIQLGQSASTLSSGESQRLKLAHYLNTAKNRRVLFIMDQPTTGLHPHDIIRLLECFDSLISVGHSMVVVEHNLDFIKHCDWIIDLGPGAAQQGGEVVATGTPETVADNGNSLTGKYLLPLLS